MKYPQAEPSFYLIRLTLNSVKGKERARSMGQILLFLSRGKYFQFCLESLMILVPAHRTVAATMLEGIELQRAPSFPLFYLPLLVPFHQITPSLPPKIENNSAVFANCNQHNFGSEKQLRKSVREAEKC